MAGLVPFNRRNSSLYNNGYTGFYNMLDDFFNDSWPVKRSLALDTFKVDVQDNEKEYLIEAEVPGINKDEIGLEMNDGKLTISIKREENEEEEKKNYIHRERKVCAMSRSIYLADARQEAIKAKLDNGVLSVVIPKVEKGASAITIDVE